MITVMAYGVITEKIGVKGEHEKEQLICSALEDAQNMGLSTINIDGTSKSYSYKMAFSAVHIIVPKDRKEEALQAGMEAGATGVTVMEAHGFGLGAMENFYNRLHHENTDANLMFIVPAKKVEAIIRNVMKKLDIVGEGAGIAYSHPIENLKGISLKSEDL
jgi:nitrogen regulatory protein PII